MSPSVECLGKWNFLARRWRKELLVASDAICISMHLCSLILCHCFFFFLAAFRKGKGVRDWILNSYGWWLLILLVLCPEYILRSDSNNNALDSAQNIQLFEGNTLWFLLRNCLAENKTFLVSKLSMVPIQTISNGNFLTENWYVRFLFCFVLSFKKKKIRCFTGFFVTCIQKADTWGLV